MFDPEQPRGLRDSELKTRHFVEFPPDSIDKCARVHSGSSLLEIDVVSGFSRTLVL